MDRHSTIWLKDIRIDGGTQSRNKLNERHLQHLTEVLNEDARLEPVEVMYDGVDYWLWDGFHRVEVFRRANIKRIRAHITQGTQRDAILKSCGANGKHGLPRCNADKRRAVTRLLTDDEWGAWPDSQLARAAGVSREYVVRLRAELIASGELSCDRSQDKQVNRGGTTYTMDTTNIGKTETAIPPVAFADPPTPSVAESTPDPSAPVDWAAVLEPQSFYLTDPKQHIVYTTPYFSHWEADRARPSKIIVQQRGAYIIKSVDIFGDYRFEKLMRPNDSTPEPATPSLPAETPAPEGQALHAAGVDDSTSPDEPTAPRHDPRAVSNTGDWTPGEKAYMNRSQAALNHAHPGKMPYVGKPVEVDEVARLKARIAELEAENEALRLENTHLKVEIVVLRNKVQPSDGIGKPAERTH